MLDSVFDVAGRKMPKKPSKTDEALKAMAKFFGVDLEDGSSSRRRGERDNRRMNKNGSSQSSSVDVYQNAVNRFRQSGVTSAPVRSKASFFFFLRMILKNLERSWGYVWYHPIIYYWTLPLIMDHSYLVGNLTYSKIAETKALEPQKS
jgi:hypothetical protein